MRELIGFLLTALLVVGIVIIFFGGDFTAAAFWVWDWIVWLFNVIKDWLIGNDGVRCVLGTNQC